MTSLSQQLQRLAIPHTQAVFADDKRRVSLLFDPKVAATFDRETVFAIGQGGLEELENVDDKFIAFEKTLFNLSSQNWERSLQTKEINQQLNETIREFLILLSPYFPLKSAHKALEWLIYRYHIHHYNKDDLLICVLPYHEMKVYVRVLQLLKLDDPSDKWNWLQAGAKNGVPLARGTLINHCTKDPGFMAFILEIVPMFIKVHGVHSPQLRAVIAFYTCAMLGALQHREQITEKMMSIVVPHLVRGFKAKSLEYRAACYMILSQLVVQVQLKEDLFDALLPVMSKRISSQLTQEALACLSLVFQTQKISNMPKKTFKHLCRIPGIILLFGRLTSKYDMDGLLRAWVQRLIPCAMRYHSTSGDMSACSSSSEGGEEDTITGKPAYTTLLHGVLTEVTLCSDELVHDITKDILEALLAAGFETMDNQLAVDSWNTLTKTLLTALENRHNKAFDRAVQEVMSQKKDDESSLGVLQEMMTLTNAPAKYQLIPDKSTSLLLGLKHHSSSMRCLTLGHVKKFIKEHMGGSTEFLEPLLLERLNDDKPGVVMATLKIEMHLTEIIEVDKLGIALLAVIKRSHRKNWCEVNEAAIGLLCKVCDGDMTFDLLPYLMVSSKRPEALQCAKMIMTNGPGDLGHILKPIKTGWLEKCKKGEDSDLCSQLNLMVLRRLVKYLQALPPQQSVHKVKELIAKCCNSKWHMFLFLVMCTLGELVSNVKGKVKDAVIAGLLSLLDAELKKDSSSKTALPENVLMCTISQMMPQWIIAINRNQMPQSVISWTACRLTEALQNENIDGTACHFITDHQRAAPMLHLLNMLMRQACGHNGNVWRHLLKKLVIDQLPLESVLPIFHYIWTMAGNSHAPVKVSADLHIGSFYLFGNLLDQLDDGQLAHVFASDSPTLVCLVLSLCYPEDCVPSIVQLLRKVKVTCSTHFGSRKIFIKKLISRPHVPHMVMKKLFNGLIHDDPSKCRVTQSDLHYFTTWLSNPQVPVQMKQQLMELLKQVNSQLLFDCLLPIVSSIAKECSQNGVAMETGLIYLLKQMFERICETFSVEFTGNARCANVLFDALKTSNRLPGAESPQDIALSHVTPSLLLALNDPELQRRLVSVLLDIGEQSTSTELSAKLRMCMIGLRLRGRHVLHELDVKDGTEIKTVKGKKRSRTAHSSPPLNYVRLSLLLEVIQAHRKVKDREELAAVLFPLLGRLLHETHNETEFCKQMTLTCLLNICSMWKEHTKPQNQELLNIEDLVQCIRTSPSPQTQQQAVLVMTAIAPLYPEYILHHVMSIFTFMGSSMLQQDDAYSFQIITKTLDTIIPALIKACADNGLTDTDEPTLIQDILRVFIDARHHIPKHRCMVLFRHLAERVGLQRHLYTMMVLQMESAVRMKDVPTAAEEVIDIMEEGLSLIDKDVESLHTLSRQFDVSVQLHSITEVMSFLVHLCQHLLQQGGSTIQSRKPKKAAEVPILTMQSLSPQQLRLIQYHTTRLVITVLSADGFITGIHATCPDDSMPSDIQGMFQTFVQRSLLLLTYVAKGHGVHGNTATSRFWRAALHKVYEVLDKVNVLLPNSVFLTVISSLLDHRTIIIRRKALDLLNNKMQLVVVDSLSQKEIKALLDIVPTLLAILQEEPPSADGKNDYTTLCQMALYSLKLLCKLLGPLHPTKFTELFSASLDIVNGSDQPVPMVGSALLCMAELCSSLKAQSLPFLPKFMPPLMMLLKDVKILQTTDLMLVCSLTMLQKVVGSLPHFLSPYLLDILLCVCRISTEQTDSTKKSQPAIRLKAVRHQLATAIAARVLVPALSQTLESLLQDNQLCLVPLFEIAQEHVESLDKEDLNAHHSALVNFYCLSLDLRNAQIKLTDEELNTIEHEAIEAVMIMVMKLSENSFRPMFYKLYDWACREESDIHKNRRLTFFRLAERLSDKLKSLFNLFVGHAMKAACDLLNANNTKNGEVDYFGTDPMAIKKTTLLLGYTISCLHKCFLHDTEGFVTKEIFASLLHPLVDQLENMIGGDSAFEQRVIDHVMPCISQLALASRDDTSWKALNYQILLKTRHVSPKVRFATLQVVEDLASKLGDEYMTLLPETVPFLAELMEDDSEEVEQKCQQVVTSLESTLGESLQQYF